MAGILDRFRKEVLSSVWKEKPDETPVELNDKIALGVLLYVVANADNQFLPEEEEQIKNVLCSYGSVSQQEIPVVFESIRKAAEERVDLFVFAREVSQDLPYNARKGIVENLFRVACVDKELAHEEEEMVRKISGLLGIDHKEFIEAKIKIKKDFGLDVAGL